MNLAFLLNYCDNLEDIQVCISAYDEPGLIYYGQGGDVPEELMWLQVDKYVLEKFKGQPLMYIYLQD